MDLLSHVLVGGLVASVGLQKEYGPVASATMVAASVAPDVDSVLMVLGPEFFFRYHRHPLTHSVGGAVLLSLVLTGVVCLATPFKRPWLVFAISLSGIVMHLLGDLLTPWPIPFFFPLSGKTYSLDLIHFFDPLLLAVLGAGFLVILRRPAWGVPVLLLVAVTISIYLGFRGYGKRVALEVARRTDPVGEATVLPHGLGPFRWDVIVKGAGYTAHVIDVWRSRIVESRAFVSADEEPAVTLSKRAGLVQAFLQRARFPVATVVKTGEAQQVEWRDVHLALSGGAVRGVVVVLDELGEVREEHFELSRK